MSRFIFHSFQAGALPLSSLPLGSYMRVFLYYMPACGDEFYLLVFSLFTPPGGWYVGQLAEKRGLEGNCEILRTIFYPRALSSNIPASQKGLYLFIYFITLRLISSTCFIAGKRTSRGQRGNA